MEGSMKVSVTVTQRDIDGGDPLNGFHCPLAYAIGRATGLRARVGTQAIKLIGNDGWIRLPVHAIKFRSDFDRGLSVHPFSFEIEAP